MIWLDKTTLQPCATDEKSPKNLRAEKGSPEKQGHSAYHNTGFSHPDEQQKKLFPNVEYGLSASGGAIKKAFDSKLISDVTHNFLFISFG